MLMWLKRSKAFVTNAELFSQDFSAAVYTVDGFTCQPEGGNILAQHGCCVLVYLRMVLFVAMHCLLTLLLNWTCLHLMQTCPTGSYGLTIMDSELCRSCLGAAYFVVTAAGHHERLVLIG